jgi:hypothetical protein
VGVEAVTVTDGWAAAWLYVTLAPGQVESRCLKEAAKLIGISGDRLQGARARLGVESVVLYGQAGAGLHTAWRLPDMGFRQNLDFIL